MKKQGKECLLQCYCAHHVVHEGREALRLTNFNESLEKVTKYDLKFEDGTIKRNVHVDDLTILEEGHHGGKRDPEHPLVKTDVDEEKMPMKTDTEDADEDGDKTDKVPAFLDKGETKKKKARTRSRLSLLRLKRRNH